MLTASIKIIAVIIFALFIIHSFWISYSVLNVVYTGVQDNNFYSNFSSFDSNFVDNCFSDLYYKHDCWFQLKKGNEIDLSLIESKIDKDFSGEKYYCSIIKSKRLVLIGNNIVLSNSNDAGLFNLRSTCMAGNYLFSPENSNDLIKDSQEELNKLMDSCNEIHECFGDSYKFCCFFEFSD